MRLDGPWSREQVARFLHETAIPLRLACNGASGHPILASLWFAPSHGLLWCATPRSARIVSRLERDGRCAFEVAPETPPYRGVRGQGRATVHRDRGERVLHMLVERYLDDPASELARWLLSRAAREAAIAIEPRRLLSWDFSERMGPARPGRKPAAGPAEARS